MSEPDVSVANTRNQTRHAPRVDRLVSLRSLGRKTDGSRMVCFTRPESDINRGKPVRIDFKPTVRALEVSVIPTPDFPAFVTSFRSVSRVNWQKCDSLLPGDGFDCFPKLAVGHALRFPVRFSVSSSTSKASQILDGDTGVKLFGEINNLVDDLIASGFRQVRLVFPEFSELLDGIPTAFVSMGFEFASSKTGVPLFVSQVLSEVELPQDFAVGRDDADSCQPLDTDIYAHYRGILFLGSKLSSEGSEDVPLLLQDLSLKWVNL